MKRWMKPETVLTVIMITVTTVLLIGATVAWFLGNKPVTIKNFMQQAGQMGQLKVEMAVLPEENETQASVPVYCPMEDINLQNKVIDIDLAKLTNIENGKLGPGSYGTIKFRISTTSSEAMNYMIRITPDIEMVEKATVGKEELLKLVQMHIKFYAKYDSEKASTPNMAYSEVIPYALSSTGEGNSANTSNQGFSGTVSPNEIKVVTIYWYWPYEYTDIPGYNVENFNSTIYNPWANVSSSPENGEESKLGEYDSHYSQEYSVDKRIELYDIDDTKIGNYVTSLKLHFEVTQE